MKMSSLLLLFVLWGLSASGFAQTSADLKPRPLAEYPDLAPLEFNYLKREGVLVTKVFYRWGGWVLYAGEKTALNAFSRMRAVRPEEIQVQREEELSSLKPLGRTYLLRLDNSMVAVSEKRGVLFSYQWEGHPVIQRDGDGKGFSVTRQIFSTKEVDFYRLDQADRPILSERKVFALEGERSGELLEWIRVRKWNSDRSVLAGEMEIPHAGGEFDLWRLVYRYGGEGMLKEIVYERSLGLPRSPEPGPSAGREIFRYYGHGVLESVKREWFDERTGEWRPAKDEAYYESGRPHYAIYYDEQGRERGAFVWWDNAEGAIGYAAHYGMACNQIGSRCEAEAGQDETFYDERGSPHERRDYTYGGGGGAVIVKAVTVTKHGEWTAYYEDLNGNGAIELASRADLVWKKDPGGHVIFDRRPRMDPTLRGLMDIEEERKETSSPYDSREGMVTDAGALGRP